MLKILLLQTEGDELAPEPRGNGRKEKHPAIDKASPLDPQ
jgi:hypothetical protein